MKTFLISTFLLIGSTVLAQNIAATKANKTLKPVKKFNKTGLQNAEKLVATADHKKYYTKLVRSVNVVKD